MHVFVWRRAARAALGVALASCIQAGALAAPFSSSPATAASDAGLPSRPPIMYAQAERGLGVLAPALPMPIKPSRGVEITAELPPCQPAVPAPAGEQESGKGADHQPGNDATGPIEQTAPAPADRAAGSEQSTADSQSAGSSPDAPRLDCTVLPTAAAEAADSAPANLDLDYIPPPPGTVPVKWGRPVGTPKPWFAGVSPEGGMQLGDRNLTYRNVDGPSVSLGSLTPFSPAWSSTAAIGGVQVSNLTTSADTTVPEGKLGYSSVWGRINNTDPTATAGGVQYGAPVGSNSLRYGLTPDVTVEGQVQSARALTTTGLGTTYSLGQWGTLQGGATQSHLDTAEGWRYSMGYNVNVFDAVKLGYANEMTSSGYGDLTTYQDGATTTRQWRDTFSAGVPVGAWGEFSGTYSGLRDTSGEMLERRYGISQSMMLSPNVRLAVGADHDVITGDFGVNMQLTMPIGGR
ncbi:MAG TPA: fimbrial protein [Bordetella sp.]|nr:fimbrial protein [Bordetella sp.]